MLMILNKNTLIFHPMVRYKAILDEFYLNKGEIVSVEKKGQILKIYRSGKYLGYTENIENFEIYNKMKVY